MSLSVKQLHNNIGAQISGLDLTKRIEPSNFEKILKALYQYQMLVFPDQKISQLNMLEFSKYFGKPEIFPDPTEHTGEVPEILRLTNLDMNGVPFGPSPRMARMSLAENWHTDSSYRKVPSFVTLLHGIEVPTVSGDTDFTSMHASFDGLPSSLKNKIENLVAIHSWEYQRTLSPGRQPMTDAERKSTPPAHHRLVQLHPNTGRKLLYISSSALSIEGMEMAQSRELIDELTRYSTMPQMTYTHHWKPLDLVMWDNRATLHRAAGFDYQSTTLRRLLHRIVIGGNPDAYSH